MNRGEQAEALVAAYLQQHGFRTVTRNFHSRYGEIDLIAENGTYLAFVEVRCRAVGGLADPLETVTPQKQARIIRTAQCYLQQAESLPLQPRFDVAAVYASGKDLSFEDIRYIENAFGL